MKGSSVTRLDGEVQRNGNARWQFFLGTIYLAFRADRAVSATLIAVLVVNAIGTSLIGVALARLVDEVNNRSAVGVFEAAVLGAACQALLEIGFRVQFSLRMDISQRVEILVQKDIAEVAACLPTLDHLEQPVYLDRITALRREADYLADFCWTILESLSLLVQLSLAVSLLTLVHPSLGALLVLALPSVWLTRRARLVEQRAADETAEDGRLAAHLLELSTNPRCAKEVCIGNSSLALRTLAAHAWDRETSRRMRADLHVAVLNLCGFLAFTAGFVGALVFAVNSVVNHRANAGEVVLVITLAGRLQGQVGHGVWLLGRLMRSLHAADRYMWLRRLRVDQDRQAVPAPARITDGIMLRDVCFRYPGTDRDALSGVNLEIPAGSLVAVVGENGAGKTTLVKLLGKFYEPTSGSVSVDGVALANLETESWRRGISAAYQDFTRFEFLLRETVGIGDLPRLGDEECVRGALSRAGALEMVEEFARGLDTRLGLTFDGAEPSLGQWQRLTLARTSMRHQPRLLILDEPTASLDARAEHELYERFAGMARRLGQESGSITVLVTHRFSTVQMADFIVVFEKGRVTEVGTHWELLEAGGLYSEMYQAQAQAYA